MNSPSILSKMLLLYLKVSRYKDKLTISWWKKPSMASSPPKNFYDLFRVEKKELQKKPVWTIKPKGNSSEKHVLFLHGGGFSKGFLNFHWAFISKLVTKLNCSVSAPDYPLSVSSTVTEVFDFLVPLYQSMVREYGASNIILMGDSAGGGMALSLAELLVEKRMEQPAQLILLSPWLDITLTNPQIDDFEARELILDRKILQQLGKEYAGDIDETHFLVSPIYGAIKRVAPTTVLIGSEEIFLPDCRKLKVRAESEPMVFNYREFKGMVHNWMFLPIPDAKKAFEMIIDQINLETTELGDLVNQDSNFWG